MDFQSMFGARSKSQEGTDLIPVLFEKWCIVNKELKGSKQSYFSLKQGDTIHCKS